MCIEFHRPHDIRKYDKAVYRQMLLRGTANLCSEPETRFNSAGLKKVPDLFLRKLNRHF